jgi:hypothetical protein
VNLALLLALVLQAPPSDLGPAAELRVLYAGAPASARMASFERFLEQWFARVDVIGLVDLTPKRAAPYDVVVADWTRRYSGERFDSSLRHGAELDDAFTKPLVMIGAVAGELFRAEQPKIDWL